jgi:hypothetical protein
MGADAFTDGIVNEVGLMLGGSTEIGRPDISGCTTDPCP